MYIKSIHATIFTVYIHYNSIYNIQTVHIHIIFLCFKYLSYSYERTLTLFRFSYIY